MKYSMSSDSKFQNLFDDFKKETDMAKIYTVVDAETQKAYDDIVESTPVRSGLTKSSWSRRITMSKDQIDVIFENSHKAKNGKPIVVYVVNGHYTRAGGYVRPNDFVSPRTDSITSNIAKGLSGGSS
jgi:hypothetical protein